MLHLHDQIANFGLELFVLGLQLAFPARWTIDQRVVLILNAPALDQTSGQLLIAGRPGDGHDPGLDLRDQLTFVFGFELSTNLSHFEYPAPQPPAKNAGREGLLKMTHRCKSAKNADSHTMLGKASHKTATLFHISNSPGDDFPANVFSFR